MLPEEFYVPELEQITTQSSSNKQMRTNEQNPYAEKIRFSIEWNNKESFKVYKNLLEGGCPENWQGLFFLLEHIRICLPRWIFTI